MRLRFIILLAVTCFVCDTALAHQDRIIEIKGEKLMGLPVEYQPASFSIDKKKISIGSKSVTIPKCIWDLFGDVKPNDLQLSSSWYHDTKLLPPYLLVSIAEDNTKNRFRLLLNLETLKIIKFQKEKRVSSTSWQFINIEISQECSRQWVVNDVQPNN